MLVIALLLPACGYQLTANSPIVLPQDNNHLFLRKVTNPSTETWMEPMLRTALRDEFTRRGNVKWVSLDQAHATVNIDVRSYSTADSVKGRDDVTIKSKATIQLEVTFYNADTGAMIWTSGPVVASESFRGNEGLRTATGEYQPTSAKRSATEAAVELAMRMVADRLSQKF